MRDYSFEILSKYFSIDNGSPSGLNRIKDRTGNNIKGYSVGTRVFKSTGLPAAWVLRFKGTNYFIHRILWVLKYGSIDPNLVIDHLDGNPFNNSIDNLSLKTTQDNSRNQRQQQNNTTGITGVNLHCKGDGRWYYRARYYDISGIEKSRCFSIEKLGDDAAKTLATAYREKQIQRLKLQGFNYTERHGN